LVTSKPVLHESIVQKTVKVTKAQATFLLECVDYFKLLQSAVIQVDKAPGSTSLSVLIAKAGSLRENAAGDAGPGCTGLFKAFRLRVKRRILQQDKDLASIQPKSEMQKALAEEFDVQRLRFQALEKTAMRLGILYFP
jgi:hypothetical protein